MGRLLEIALEGIFIYFLYKLVFDFIIPVYRSGKKMHDNIKNMQDKMQQGMDQNRQNQYNTTTPPQQNIKEGDYIDFEEVKDSH
ncbi:MAG: hypothetical protein ACRDE2_11240 [Chitinophagaceae bacterium]